MFLTAVDLCGAETVPTQTPGGGEVPFPAQEHARPESGGKLTPLWGTLDKPRASDPESSGQEDERCRVRTLALTGSLGSLGALL